MTNGEIRLEGGRLLRQEGWMFRLLFTTALFFLIGGVVSQMLTSVYGHLGARDLQMFAAEQVSSMAAGELPQWPAAGDVRALVLPTLFTDLKELLLAGIFLFGFKRVYLKAVRGERENWFAGVMGGFRDPAGVLWLGLRVFVQTALWSLLFVVPGIVAAYRYSQVWMLKADHPEWTAGECLAESRRLMDGCKMSLFSLHASYWRLITLFLAAVCVALGGVLVVVRAAVATGAATGKAVTAEELTAAMGPFSLLAGLALPSLIAAFVLRFLVRWNLGMGNALFYRELPHGEPAAEVEEASPVE